MFANKYLMDMARLSGKLMAKHFGIRYKFIRPFPKDHPNVKDCAGICYPDSGEIFVNVYRHCSNKYYRIEDIVDTVAHELAHIKFQRHGKKFWAFLKEMKSWFNAKYMRRAT